MFDSSEVQTEVKHVHLNIGITYNKSQYIYYPKNTDKHVDVDVIIKIESNC